MATPTTDSLVRVQGVILDADTAAFLGAALRQLIKALDRLSQRPVPRVYDLERQLSSSAASSVDTAPQHHSEVPSAVSTTNLLDTEAAAAILHCTAENIRGLCRRGSLPAQRVAGRWLIPAEAVLERSETRREAT
ncbi:helix-turn-helix domain-containing protein [Rhodococcus erythropolis]|uniref:helix-turn-helix domain-containing protein n=1 Tax=Rhodococcus erythropolis TaxID=1833 RepID=UPI00379772BC